jgi:hypothetical protein
MVDRSQLDDPALGRRRRAYALARFPLASLNPLDRPYGHLAMASAAVGEVDRAQALLAEFDGTPDADHSLAGELWADGARGVVALAEG